MVQPIACSSLTFVNQPLEAALAGVARLGFSHVDLAVFEGWGHVAPSVLAADVDEVVAHTLEVIARSGLAVNALNVGLGDTGPEARDARLTAVCALAAALKVRVLTLQSPSAQCADDDAIRMLEKTRLAVESHGLVPAFETHTDTVMEDPQRVLRLLERMPDLRLTLDQSHYVFGNVRSDRWREFLPAVGHVHLRDSGPDTERIQVEPGTGQVDTADLLKRLAAAHYAGPISIEYIDGMGDVDAAACAVKMREQLEAVRNDTSR